MSDLTLRDGRSLGTLTLTPEDDEGTYELVLDQQMSRSLHDYALVSMEACLESPTDHWKTVGFEGAAYDLLFHMATHHLVPPHEAMVRLFTIDEAQHGPLDSAIEEIHTALRSIEESREVVRKIRAHLAGMGSIS